MIRKHSPIGARSPICPLTVVLIMTWVLFVGFGWLAYQSHRDTGLSRQGRAWEAQKFLPSEEYESQNLIQKKGMEDVTRHLTDAVSTAVANERRVAFIQIVASFLLLPCFLIGWVAAFRSVSNWRKTLDQQAENLIELNESLDLKVAERTEELQREILKHRKDEQRLRQSETTYRALFDSSRDAVMILEPPSWNFTSANPATIEMFGARDEAEFVSRGPAEVSPEFQPDGRLSSEKAKEMIETAIKVGWSSFEWQHQRLHGEEFLTTVQLTRIELDTKVFLQATVRDISEWERAEKKLRMLYGAVEQSSSTVVITDADGNIEYANPQFEVSTGYTLKEAYGQNPRVLKSGKQTPEFYEDLWKTISAGRIWRGEFLNKRKDGTFYWEAACISPVFDAQGSITQYVAVKDDITDRRNTEAALRESEKRFMDVLHAADDAILLIDGEKFVDCNDATARMLGYTSRDEFLMTHPSELSPPKQPDGRDSFEKAGDMIRTAFENGFHRFEWMHRRAGGEVFPVEVSLTPITHEGKTVLHCLWRDLTEAKRAEDERVTMLRQMNERRKEQTCMYEVTRSILQRETLEEIFLDVAALIPSGWQYPEIARGSVMFEDKQFVVEPFEESEWKQVSDIIVDGERCGSVGVYYQQEPSDARDGLFLNDEHSLIDGIAQSLSGAVARKRAETRLRGSQQFLQTVIDAIPDSLMVIGRDHRIALANQAVHKMTGNANLAVERLKCHQVSHGSDVPCQGREHPCPREKVIATKAPVCTEHIHYDSKGNEVFVEVSSAPVLDEAGEVSQVIEICRDVTERKKDQLKLEETAASLASANDTLEELVQADRAINAKLAEKLEEVEAFNQFAVGRELRMVELKREINGLLAEQGRPPTYQIADLEEVL